MFAILITRTIHASAGVTARAFANHVDVDGAAHPVAFRTAIAAADFFEEHMAAWVDAADEVVIAAFPLSDFVTVAEMDL